MASKRRQKADGGRATRLLNALDLRWSFDSVVFDLNNPHPEFGMVPAEYIFVTRDGENSGAFNSESMITSGLQELIAIYSGTIEHRKSVGETDFVPLLNTSMESGVLAWQEFVDDGGINFMSMQPTAVPRRDPPRRIDGNTHTIAAHVTAGKDNSKLNAIYVADIDMISDFFFQERNLGSLDVEFDNVTFILNAVDALIGDESVLELRSRRAAHRTLTRFEAWNRTFLEDANKEQKKAADEADDELEKRREQLRERVKEIDEDDSIDPIAKTQMLQQAQEAEQQRMDLAKAQIDQRKDDQIRKIDANTKRQQQTLQSRTRFWAVLVPPIPAILVGMVVFFRRWSSERRNVVASRRRHK